MLRQLYRVTPGKLTFSKRIEFVLYIVECYFSCHIKQWTLSTACLFTTLLTKIVSPSKLRLFRQYFNFDSVGPYPVETHSQMGCKFENYWKYTEKEAFSTWSQRKDTRKHCKGERGTDQEPRTVNSRASELQIHREVIRRILQRNLQFYSYKLQIV